MTVQTFRNLLAERPFKPFRLIMSSGEKYEVHEPTIAWLTRSDLLVATAQSDGLPTQFRICSLLNVATVEPIESQAA